MTNKDTIYVKQYSKYIVRTLKLIHTKRTHTHLYTITQSAMKSIKQLAIFQYHYKALYPTTECFYQAGYPKMK